MRSWINKKNFFYRIQQLIILLAHLLLLKWILYTLHEGGVMSTKQLLGHFCGMALFGALLIRITAYLTQRQYLKEKNNAK